MGQRGESRCQGPAFQGAKSLKLRVPGLSSETRTGWNEFRELCVFILPGGLGVGSREMTHEKERSESRVIEVWCL